jgi:hypothetical protein
MRLQITNNNFNTDGYWRNPIEDTDLLLTYDSVYLFDQNGYHLTPTEMAYADAAKYPTIHRRHEWMLCKEWMTSESLCCGPHINHCQLLERKGFADEAKEQMISCATWNPLLWKLIRMRPKWGIDMSIDYVDDDGNVFEVFHYEWDNFDYNSVQAKKEEIEKFALLVDWADAAASLLKRKNEWADLSFFEMSKWKTDFFGLSPEKFKDICWEK